MGFNEQAVLKTVLYADIFDFSLTEGEIWKYLIADKKISQSGITQGIDRLIKTRVLIGEKSSIALYGKKGIIVSRRQKLKLVKQKIEIAKKASSILQTIPSILFVGISGGLAVGNVKDDDDIDLFIISEGNVLWMTRMLSVLLLSRYGIRRTRGDRHEKNKVCLNMFLSRTHLAFTPSRWDIYTAHELAQLKPLFSRERTYETLVSQNKWISTYLPNRFEFTPLKAEKKKKKTTHGFLFSKPMVQLAKLIQTLYMLPHKTTETVSDTVFAFHPHDYRREILRAYKERLQRYNLQED